MLKSEDFWVFQQYVLIIRTTTETATKLPPLGFTYSNNGYYARRKAESSPPVEGWHEVTGWLRERD
jgi:hypothetical protein